MFSVVISVFFLIFVERSYLIFEFGAKGSGKGMIISTFFFALIISLAIYFIKKDKINEIKKYRNFKWKVIVLGILNGIIYFMYFTNFIGMILIPIVVYSLLLF